MIEIYSDHNKTIYVYDTGEVIMKKGKVRYLFNVFDVVDALEDIFNKKTGYYD